MGRKSGGKSSEPEFGSDSFLDVLANIVGILIILIVLCGVRIRREPPSSTLLNDEAIKQAQLEAIEDWEAAKAKIEEENIKAEWAYKQATEENKNKKKEQEELLVSRRREQEKLDRERDEHLAEAVRREKILRQYEDEATRLQAELDEIAYRLDLTQKEVDSKEAAKQNQLVAMEQEINDKTTTAAELEKSVKAETHLLAMTSQTDEQLRQQILELRKQIDGAVKETRETKKIRHYITPLARKVQQHELHFRCKNNRIAYTNLDELLVQTKEQAVARITQSTSRLDGVAGPIGGFRLKYVLARPNSLVSEQVMSEGAAARFALVYWELDAESDFVGETKEQVLAPNSALRVKLRSLPATRHSVTLWVYGDSFEVAKEVEQFLHEQSYTVALRPLPDGIPIIGSPMGSASHSH